MIKKFMIALLLLNTYFFICSQEPDNTEYATVLAELVNSKPTGKRHNSFIFTFKIKDVLSGTINDSIIVSQEIYHDFGAKQTLSKIYPNKYLYNIKDEPAKDVIIKYSYQKNGKCNIIWLAEKHRRKSLESLEIYLKSYFKKKRHKMYEYILLKESNGKLFFSDDKKKGKVAVEIYPASGNWIIAVIENWEE